ncbi:hypothetical protein CSIM01_12033 [Colletotrichum simmondsii]|uniref:Uncharacterized protein n=1 Tax=Colletotrichum simmondsii TaxID=703756 RepID=A0A135RU01_9PEZI|nr:hypothetical protein CSIM01_12033 [Colletotrichum simmondsii]
MLDPVKSASTCCKVGSRPPTNGPLEDWAAFVFAGRASRQVLHLLISSGRVSRLSKLLGPATNLHLRISTSPIVFNNIACAVAFVCSSAPVPSLLYQLRQPTTQSPLSFAYRLWSAESREYGLKKFGLLPPTQLSITNTTPRRAPFASHAIPLRAPADRLDLPVGTACLHLKLLGALQTSDGPSFGAKSQRLPEPRLMF